MPIRQVMIYSIDYKLVLGTYFKVKLFGLFEWSKQLVSSASLFK